MSTLNELVEKRLHVSGLTPQISQADLTSRFKSFGAVKSVDDLGKLDGNGFPKPFAYVTLQASKGQLAKCMNLLSGTVWKGAKLRIGEAKPDFQDRIKNEKLAENGLSEKPDDPRPKKKRRILRGCQGIHSNDMSLVTPENLTAHPNWKKTPLGRLVLPVKMRPSHPLPDTDKLLPAVPGLRNSAKIAKSRKKRAPVLTRARRRTIDPLRFGSTYIKGVLLASTTTSNVGMYTLEEETRIRGSQVGDNVLGSTGRSNGEPSAKAAPAAPASEVSVEYSEDTLEEPLPTVPAPETAPEEGGIVRETARSLAILDSLFVDRDDWCGQESLSDVDMADDVSAGGADLEDEPTIPTSGAANVETTNEGKSSPPSEDEVEQELDDPVLLEPSKAGEVHAAKLKDLFAPRQEDAGFSLMDGLDVDLELDDTLSFMPQKVHDPTLQAPSNVRPVSAAPVEDRTTPTTFIGAKQRRIQFDPSKPLFFPISLDADGHFIQSHGKLKDVITVAKEKGLMADFYRTESTEDIRASWEKGKLELTRQWKRRHREALKSVKRRGADTGKQD